MTISCFDDLIRAAHAQPDPQRLLFVFTGVEQPEGNTPAQQKAYESGAGGHLIPLACVDKTPQELTGGFTQLCDEATQFVPDWSIVFAGAMGGVLPEAPTSEQAQEPLDQMIEMIKAGRVATLNAFDRQGQAVMLHATTDYDNFEPVLMNQQR